MISWFYHFTERIETEAQEKDSLAKLDIYIDEVEKEGKVSPGLITATKTFLPSVEHASRVSLELKRLAPNNGNSSGTVVF